ncbi:serine/threonine-protein kinase [Kitasatospora griseola]|uniref:serine/threonine-protein kinase n=1 Tax=Kitasatospora griseola TaxID=2064 RepID=UPI00381ACC73
MTTAGAGGQLIDGRFELLTRLGAGGMGMVWRARDTVLQREVALKEVRPPDSAVLAADPAAEHELRERVLREAQALARLQHPNVVTIHHIVDNAELPHPWLVMELVTGGSLHDRISRGPLSPQEAARIGRGLLAALTAAHAAGIQHRDVKPGNVLLRPDGTPVLTDFGIAALSGATTLTATGALIGSPEYIAPERIRGHEGNPASDLWSLGMTLYVAVEGHHPLRRATSIATLAAVLDQPLPPPLHAGPLGPTLLALLDREPADRPDAVRLDRLLAAAEQGLDGTVGGSAVFSPTETDTPSPQPPRDANGPATGHPPVRAAAPSRRRTRLMAAVSGIAVVGLLGWAFNQDLFDSRGSGGAGSQATGTTGSGSTSGPTRSAGPSGSPSGAGSSDSPRPGGSTPAVNTAAVMGLPVCSASQLSLELASAQNSYQPNDRPHLALTIRNSSGTACRVDLGRTASTLTVDSSMGERIWSSGDCPADSSAAWAQLAGNTGLTETFVWDRTRSKPDCATADPTPARPGTYFAQADLAGPSGGPLSARSSLRLENA